MGIFDKIKQAKNFITGGGAKLYVEQLSSEASNVTCKITCHVADADINVSRVYLQIRAEERIELLDYDFDIEGHRHRERIEREVITYEHEMEIGEGQTMEANSNHEWEVTIPVPENVAGTYQGVHATHVWEVLAALDKSGNDPDSGWQEIEVWR